MHVLYGVKLRPSKVFANERQILLARSRIWLTSLSGSCYSWLRNPSLCKLGLLLRLVSRTRFHYGCSGLSLLDRHRSQRQMSVHSVQYLEQVKERSLEHSRPSLTCTQADRRADFTHLSACVLSLPAYGTTSLGSPICLRPHSIVDSRRIMEYT